MLDSVKVKSIDESISSRGGRVLDVKISSSRSFSTPIRPISTIELQAKSRLGYREEIEAQLAALPVDISGTQKYEAFLKNNGEVSKIKSNLQSLSDVSYFYPKFPILQMPKTISPNDVLPLKIAYDIQCNVDNLDYICIPLVKSDDKSYEKMIADWCKSAESDCNRGCVPQLDLIEKPDVFSKKLDLLIEHINTGEINIINLKYSDPNKARVTYTKLWEKRSFINAIINCSEVPEYSGQNESHIKPDIEEQLIMYGIDSITRRKTSVSQKVVAYFRKQNDTQANIKYSLAIHDAAAHISGKVWENSNGIRCGCSICRYKSPDALIDEFARGEDHVRDDRGLKEFSKIHDHQSDQLELNIMRKYIVSNELVAYEEKIEENRSKLSRLLNVD